MPSLAPSFGSSWFSAAAFSAFLFSFLSFSFSFLDFFSLSASIPSPFGVKEPDSALKDGVSVPAREMRVLFV